MMIEALIQGKPQKIEFAEGTTPEQIDSVLVELSTPKPTTEQVVGGNVQKFGQGLTLGFGDELQAGLAAGAGGLAQRGAAALGMDIQPEAYGDIYNRNLDQSRTAIAAAEQETPKTAMGLEIAGALAGGIAGASTKLGSNIAARVGSGNLGARVLKGAATGAASGGIYGAGTSEEGQRLEGAGEGAILGGVAGGAIPVAGAALRKTVAPTIRKITDKVVAKEAIKAGEVQKESLSPALQKVYDRLRADFPDDADFKKALYSYAGQKDKALLQAGGARTSNLAEGASLYPSGEAKAVEFFDEATSAAGEKMKTSLSKTISPSTNFSDDMDTLLEVGREKAAPIYEGAFKANPSVQSPIISKILQTPEGKTALSEAVKNMQNEMARVAKPDPELTAMARELAEIGMGEIPEGGVARGFKLKTLDYVKRSMDDTIRSAYRTGKSDAEIARFVSLKNALVDQLDNADTSGLYPKARATSGDYLSAKTAMEDGLKFLSDDVENIPRRLSNMDAAQKEAYKAGVVKTVRNAIDKTNDGANVSRIFNKPATQKKLEALLSPAEYTKLLNDAKATDDLFKLRNKITGNSRTAARQIAAEEFDDAGKELILDLATKSPTQVLINGTVNMVKRKFSGLSDTAAKDVAEILFEKDPKKKYQIVKSLVNEANSTTGLRATEAGKKLEAFYTVSDKIAKAKLPTAPAAGGVAASSAGQSGNAPRQRLSVTITPKDKR
jgi:hypothetical protein